MLDFVCGAATALDLYTECGLEQWLDFGMAESKSESGKNGLKSELEYYKSVSQLLYLSLYGRSFYTAVGAHERKLETGIA